MKTLLILVAVPMFWQTMFACQTVEGDRILGRDFTIANSAFAALGPKVEIAAAPVPGMARMFHADELARVARLNNIMLTPPVAEICFERATESLTAEKLMPVLRAALAIEDARIEIVDFSRTGVPQGTLSFSKSGLSASGFWRGRVVYDTTRTVPIWVKVRVTAERTWIEAVQPIPSATLIDSAQIAIKNGPRFPFGAAPLESIDLVKARKSLRSIRAGEPIFAAMLTTPRDIERGDTVHVSVASGGALLEFDGVAQSPARIGESVLVKNLESNRYFQARVDEKGKVSVTK